MQPEGHDPKNDVTQVYGAFRLLAPDHEQLFAYTKTLDGITALVLMNFGRTEVNLKDIDGLDEPWEARLVLANYADVGHKSSSHEVLRGWEGRVYVRTGGP